MAPAKSKHRSNAKTSARELCCRILTEAETEQHYLDQVLERRLANSKLSAKDRALVTALANGTMRYRARLDTELADSFRKDYNAARPLLKNILRTALFQMRFMDRVPEYAAIHEAVKIARKNFGEAIARLCNGVLRNVQRNPYAWPEIEELLANNEIARLAQYLSYPEWLLQRWLELYGREEAVAIAKAFNRIPNIAVRVVRPALNRSSVFNEFHQRNIQATEVEGIPNFYFIDHHDRIAELESFKKGRLTIQDPSAGLVASLAAPQADETIIDLCAAPGGKTFHLAELSNAERITAVDVNAKRLQLLQSAASRLGMRIKTCVANAREFSAPAANLVLVDAPCSGLGVLGKRSDLRWHRDADSIAELVVLQKEILENAARLVKAGGRLIYSTCTIEPLENEQVASWFLENHSGFELQRADRFVDTKFCDAAGFVRTFPHRHGIDGSFAVRFVKKVKR